jgi:hypothetical protein
MIVAKSDLKSYIFIDICTEKDCFYFTQNEEEENQCAEYENVNNCDSIINKSSKKYNCP